MIESVNKRILVVKPVALFTAIPSLTTANRVCSYCVLDLVI